MTKRQAVVDQIKNGCVNFNGFGIMEHDNRKCRAGIVIRELVGADDFGWHKRAPCIATNQTIITCPHQRFPTPDEAEIIAAENETRTQHMMTAIDLCAAHSEKKGFVIGDSFVTGQVKCPACGAVLGYSRAGSNGHIHGVCMRPECTLEFRQ